MSEPLSRRGVAKAPTPQKARTAAQYIRNPMLAASVEASSLNLDGDFNSSTGAPKHSDTLTASYAKRFGRWFDRQRKLGANSGWTIAFWSGFIVYISYRFLNNYIRPWKNENVVQSPRLRYGMADSHNMLFSLPLADGSQSYEPEEIGSQSGNEFERPTFIGSETPDKLPRPAKYVVMQLREFDETEGIDFFSRSLHVADIPDIKDRPKASVQGGSNIDSPATRAFGSGKPLRTEHEIVENPIKEERTYRESLYTRAFGRLFGNGEPTKPHGQLGSGDGTSGTNVNGSGADIEYIHGMARCSAITPLNNCVNDARKVPLEIVRKMLVALGPIHILRDPLNHYLPFRMYLRKEYRQDLLFLGLGNAAAVPNFVHRQYPHYMIDCVEGDAGLVRVLRKYFGFKEANKMNLIVEDPAEYVRRISTTIPENDDGTGKLGNYDCVWVDLINEQGLVPREYSRLEFISNVRDCMSGRGILVMNIPNKDDRILNSVISNVRMVFEGRSVILMHCKTSNNTVLLTFNDLLGKGYPKMGDCADPEHFKELMKAFLSHYIDEARMPVDLLSEVRSDTYQNLLPGRKYTVRTPGAMPR